MGSNGRRRGCLPVVTTLKFHNGYEHRGCTFPSILKASFNLFKFSHIRV